MIYDIIAYLGFGLIIFVPLVALVFEIVYVCRRQKCKIKYCKPENPCHNCNCFFRNADCDLYDEIPELKRILKNFEEANGIETK